MNNLSQVITDIDGTELEPGDLVERVLPGGFSGEYGEQGDKGFVLASSAERGGDSFDVQSVAGATYIGTMPRAWRRLGDSNNLEEAALFLCWWFSQRRAIVLSERLINEGRREWTFLASTEELDLFWPQLPMALRRQLDRQH